MAVQASGASAAYYTILATMRWGDDAGPLYATWPGQPHGAGVASAFLPIGSSHPPLDAYLTARTQWAPKLFRGALSSACSALGRGYTDKIVVVTTSRACSIEQQVYNIQTSGGVAAVVVGAAGVGLEALQGLRGFSRDASPPTPLVTIPVFVTTLDAWTANVAPHLSDAALRLAHRASPLTLPQLLPRVPQAFKALRGEMVPHAYHYNGGNVAVVLSLSVEYGDCELCTPLANRSRAPPAVVATRLLATPVVLPTPASPPRAL